MASHQRDKNERRTRATVCYPAQIVVRYAAVGAASMLGRGFSALAQTGDTVRIGVLLPLTGDADMYARQMRMGIETAIQEINDAAGVMGRPLEAAYRDSETTPPCYPIVAGNS